MTFLEAVAKKEGFGASPHNRPTRNNNPGNLQWGPFAREHGALHIEVMPSHSRARPRFAYFPDPETGWEAMRVRFTTGMYKGLTVEKAIHKWAPPIENDTEAYIRFVCKHVGCDRHDKVEELINAARS